MPVSVINIHNKNEYLSFELKQTFFVLSLRDIKAVQPHTNMIPSIQCIAIKNAKLYRINKTMLYKTGINSNGDLFQRLNK